MSCLDLGAEAVCELYDSFVLVTESSYELPAYVVMAAEAAVNLSVLFVIVTSTPLWWSSALPWSSPAPPWKLRTHLLCCGGYLHRLGFLLHPGTLLCRLCPGSLLHWFRLGLLLLQLHPGSLLCWLCLSSLFLHFHMDLALYPSPCSASIWSIWKPLLGGGLSHIV